MQNHHQLVPATCTTACRAVQFDLALRQLLLNMSRNFCCRAAGLRPRFTVAATTGTNGADDIGDNCVLSVSCRVTTFQPETLQRPLAARLPKGRLARRENGEFPRGTEGESVATQKFSHIQLAVCQNEAFISLV